MASKKRCSRCKEVKLIEHFYRRGAVSGVTKQCLSCRQKVDRARLEKQEASREARYYGAVKRRPFVMPPECIVVGPTPKGGFGLPVSQEDSGFGLKVVTDDQGRPVGRASRRGLKPNQVALLLR